MPSFCSTCGGPALLAPKAFRAHTIHMSVSKGTTEFLPAARADAETVFRQRAAVLAVPKLVEILEAVHDIVLFLNKERQIVYANKAAVEYILAHGGSPKPGGRWGEALLCEHASAAGCGTTRFCRNCGAARAILGSRQGRDEIEECRITQSGGDALDFRVKTTRMRFGEDDLTVFTAVDAGDEKRREALENTFYHDVMNTAFGIRGLMELLPEETPAEREASLKSLDTLSTALIEEITAQKDLLAAENRNLMVRPVRLDSLALLTELVAAYKRQSAAKGIMFVLDPASAGAQMTGDRTLLRRVIGNMIKNALEATAAGETITIGCSRNSHVEFWVHNPAVMTEDVRLQVFRRSFSTKSAGRGLGTYSMKMLTERYLGGTLDFTSEAGKGTRFSARYPLALPSNS